MLTKRRLFWERIAVLILGLAAWQLASGRLVSADYVGRPSTIFATLWQWVASGEIWTHVVTTAYEAVAGYAAGAVGGIVIGVLLGLNPFLAKVADPVITAVYAVPKVTFAPLLIMAFGIYVASKVALTALIVFFFVFYDTFRGVRSVSAELQEIVAIMGASRVQLFRYIIWPTTLEWVVDGLKISVPYAFIGAVAGEIIIANKGLGYLVRQHANNLNVDGVFAALTVLLVFSTLVNWVINRARANVSRWRGETVV